MSSAGLTVNAEMFSASPIQNSKNNSKQNGENSLQENCNDIQQIRRNVSSGSFQESRPEGRVLVLYTGGTIGMVRNKEGGNFLFF